MEDINRTSEEVSNEELVQCQIQLQQVKDNLLRVTADFENFRRRTTKERTAWIEDAQAEVLIGILPIIDDFERAFQQAQDTSDPALVKWLQGFSMIRKSLYEILSRYDVQPLATDLPFDPQIHEAISEVIVPNSSVGQIVSTVRQGFRRKDRILRPAQVVVAKQG